jgi:hypothetical protein
MSARLDDIRAKIERANEHILDLEARIQAFRSNNPYGVVTEDDGQSGRRVYKAKVNLPIPSDFSLVTGDALHNLRTALDYLAGQLVESNGETPDHLTCFPTYQRPPKDESQFMRKVQGMSPFAIGLIETVQPYKTGNDALWHLSQLDNMDKHRIPLKATSSRQPAFLFPIDLGDLPPGGIISIPGMFEFCGGADLEDGTVLAKANLPADNVEFQLAFEIAFGKSTVVEGQPVLPLLHQFVELVESVIDLFVRFL